ncbi:hypothetical protein HYR99_23605 [Candidatus Poribacteria bacterium]|nr:hypothetical protein [Candidatus Poribacteria bacterium]
MSIRANLQMGVGWERFSPEPFVPIEDREASSAQPIRRSICRGASDLFSDLIVNFYRLKLAFSHQEGREGRGE